MSWQRRRSLPQMERGVVILTLIAVLLVYVAYNNGKLTSDSLLYFLLLIPSIILHEISHGVVALWCGDDTAKRAGRLTLNPLRHIDVWGTLLLPAFLVLTSGVAFGYAKPVPVNTNRLRRPRDHNVLVALAGPLTNIVLAVVAAGGIHLVLGRAITSSTWEWVLEGFLLLGLANVRLAVFNLLPIPPLDGSAVVEWFLPQRYWAPYLRFRQYSMLLLLALVLLRPGAINAVFQPAVHLWAHLLPSIK